MESFGREADRVHCRSKDHSSQGDDVARAEPRLDADHRLTDERERKDAADEYRAECVQIQTRFLFCYGPKRDPARRSQHDQQDAEDDSRMIGLEYVDQYVANEQ